MIKSVLNIFMLIPLLLIPVRGARQQHILQHTKNNHLTDAEAPAKSLIHKIDSFFTDFLGTYEFNGVILIAQHGKVIYENAAGYANYEKKDTLQLQSTFQLASVSKQFTAMAIMMLKEQALLDYEDSIQCFYPAFPYHGITIRHLLTHRSGLADYMYFCETLTDRKTVLSNQDVVNLMIQEKPDRYYAPGRVHDYCNTNYCLLAAIVEKISGMPFKTFLQKNIFTPLGMKNTFVWPKGDTLPTQELRTTKGYHFRWLEALRTYQDGVTGDKGVYSTVEDLLRWDQALYTEKLVKHSSLQQAFEPGNEDLSPDKNYGFGWRIRTYENGTQLLFHGGWWRGYNSVIARTMNNQSTVIFLTNERNGSLMHNLRKLLYILHPNLYPKPYKKVEEKNQNEIAKNDNAINGYKPPYIFYYA